jgi:hydroxyacylglutathione hydrolase
MAGGVKTISLSLPFGLGKVNCYLVETVRAFALIDTGLSWNRAALGSALASAGCNPGNLALVVLTHGDLDHSGNAAYLRSKYGAKLAIHRGESDVINRGNMTLSRNNTPFIARKAMGLLKLSETDRFEPDLYVEDGQDLSNYGFEARVIHIPGHSNGSIGIFAKVEKASAGSAQAAGANLTEPSYLPTSEPALFCGDLLINPGKPALNSLMDDLNAANASVKRLSGLGIERVYPGHGEPFAMEEFLRNYRVEQGD